MADYSNVSFKNNGKLKLLIIVGTRPEIIRLAAVINKTRKYFDVILAHTGQNYDYNLNGVFFHDLELADPEVYMDAVGADLGGGRARAGGALGQHEIDLRQAVTVGGDAAQGLRLGAAGRVQIDAVEIIARLFGRDRKLRAVDQPL